MLTFRSGIYYFIKIYIFSKLASCKNYLKYFENIYAHSGMLKINQ